MRQIEIDPNVVGDCFDTTIRAGAWSVLKTVEDCLWYHHDNLIGKVKDER